MTSRILFIATIIITYTFLSSITAQANQQAQINVVCSRQYTNCQSQCVYIELTSQPKLDNNGVPRCSIKNNYIARCRNICYNYYIQCRGGK